MATELAVQAAVVDLERKTRLLLYALTAVEDASRADFAAFRTALEKVHQNATRLREQAARS